MTAPACVTSSVQSSSSSAPLAAVALAPGTPHADLFLAAPLDPAVDWSDRTVHVTIDAPPEDLIVELLDPGGGRLAARAFAAGTEPATVAVTQDCMRADCGAEVRVRVRRLHPGSETVAIAGNATAEATGFGPTPSVAPMTVERLPAAPDAPDAGAVRAPSNLRVDVDAQVAADLVVLEGAACDDLPWFVPLPPDAPGTEAPALRLISATGDELVTGGEALALPAEACDGGRATVWIVLASPVTAGTAQASWALLGDRATIDAARVVRAEQQISTTPTVSLGATPEALTPLPLGLGLGQPTEAHHLVLAEGVDIEATPRTGGGPDLVVVEPAGSARFFPVVAGPCPPSPCPEELDLQLQYDLRGGPVDGPIDARAAIVALRAVV